MSCRSRLSNLNEKLTEIERKVDYIEAKVARSGEKKAKCKFEFVDCEKSITKHSSFDAKSFFYIVAKEKLSFARPRLLLLVGDERRLNQKNWRILHHRVIVKLMY